jgi:hypothetical protein
MRDRARRGAEFVALERQVQPAKSWYGLCSLMLAQIGSQISELSKLSKRFLGEFVFHELVIEINAA